MQDIHSIGGGGRFFGGGGDKRLRPNNHHQALNCPRCDSVNTKFCYYNNYNLSQPRHFCKSCRRYWTKGGVLRNVPVGGGCRKSKRSKPKSTASTAADEDSTQERKSNSHSSSESSSLTATTTTAGTNASGGGVAAAEVVSASTSNSTLPNFIESGFFMGGHSTKPSFEQQPLVEGSTEGQIFQDIGSFTSLMTSSNDPVGFNMAHISTYRLEQNELVENQNSNDQSWRQPPEMIGTGPADDLKMPEMNPGFFDQTGQIEFSGLQQRRTNNSALAPVDWQTGGDGGGGFFDLTGDQCYWSQTQWNENDHSLNYLP